MPSLHFLNKVNPCKNKRNEKDDKIKNKKQLCNSIGLQLREAPKLYKTKVLVIGNGPSGLALSYLLNGNIPYFSTIENGPHPCETFNSKLDQSVSLYDQDLEPVLLGLIGRSKSPVSVLFDSLLKPNIDFDWDNVPRMNFRKENRAIPHLVIGSGKPGGVWNNMQTDMLTVSYGDWMDLPGYSLSDWLSSMPETKDINPKKERIFRKYVADYYRNYPALVDIEHNFLNDSTVISVALEEEKTCKNCHPTSLQTCLGHTNKYRVKAKNNSTQETFFILCDKVVFASGIYDNPRTLDFKGNCLPNVFNSAKAFLNREDEIISNLLYSPTDCFMKDPIDLPEAKPVLVVGSGLSAADAVLHLMEKGVPVIHIYHKSRGTSPISKCPKASYPEYAKLYEMMKCVTRTELYEPIPDTDIVSYDEFGNVILRSNDYNEVSRKACSILILVGNSTRLSVTLSEKLARAVDLDDLEINNVTFEIQKTEGLYAIGSLFGDNFVRFAIGSSFGVARSLFNS